MATEAEVIERMAERIAATNIRDESDPCDLIDWIAELFTDEHPTMKQRMDAVILADKAIAAVTQAALSAIHELGLAVVPKDNGL